MKITTLKSVFKSFFLALILLVFHIEFSSAQNSSKKSEQTHKQGSNNRLLAPIQITGNFSICLPGPSTTQLTGSGGSGVPRPVTPWQSSNPLVATVDNTGLVTQVGFGTTTITYYDDAGNQTSQNVYVSTYPTVSGPTAAPPSACAGVGQVQLTGSLFPHPTTPWTSANTAIATVDNNGLVTGVGAGIVNITYMNFGGCTASIPVTINPLLSPSISCGVPTYNSVTFTWPAVSGAATYTVAYSINAGPYVFGTSGNITSWTKNGLNPGDSVTVFITPSGAAGNCFTGAFQTCVALSCDAFSTPTAPVVGTITQPTCSTATGSVELTGLPAGAWTINPGNISGSGATYTVTGLATGSYTFTVKNSFGCTSVASASATINTQPPTPAAPTIGTITQTTCASATGSVQLTGLPAGTWTINPGAIAGSGATYTMSGLAAGSYTFTVTNVSSCTSAASASATINTQPVTPSAPTIGTITQTTCASVTGSIELTGLPAGAWTINPGAIAGSGATYTLSGLAAGSYSYTVTNAVGCTSAASASATINTQPVTPSAPTIGTITQTTCASATGSIELTGLPAGAWTINPGAIAGSGATYTVIGLAAGTYNFTVTNAAGCTSAASASATINTQPPTPAAPTIGTITQTTCASATGSVQLTGLPTGAWTINPGAIAGSGATYTVSGLAAGTYNFTVTNSVGCPSASASVTINAQPVTPSAPTIGTITQTTCASATGSIELTGLPAGAWTINPGAIAGSGATYTVIGLAAGTYNFTVTNAAGCTSAASASATINTQPVTPSAPTIGTITQTTCASATGSIELTGLPAGAWTINPGAIAGSGATYTISGLSAGSYSYTVTNSDGCTSVASASATINTQPVTPSAPTIGTITQTTCASATGSIELTGLPAGAWTINPGAIAGSGATYTVIGLAAGTYNFTVTNAIGCPSAASASATINTQPVTPSAPTIGTITQTTCASATGSIELTGLPAGAWTINPGAIAGSGATYTISGLSAGSYSYTVTNSDGCTSVASASATINTQPVTPSAPTIGTITQTTCASATGSIELTGLPIGAWTINPGAIAGSGATYTISGLSAGSYSYTVTNSDGCTSVASATTNINTQPATPAAPVSTGPIIECEKLPLQILDARNAITNVAGINYTWYDSAGSTVLNPILSSPGTATYYVEANNGFCTSNSRTQVILQILNAPSAPIFGNDTTECAQSPIQTLTAMVVVPPGQVPVWYNVASGGSPISSSPTLNSIGTVTYYAEAFNGTCSSTTRLPVTLTIKPTPPTPISSGDITECQESPTQTLDARDAITSTPGPGVNYIWYDSAGLTVANPTLSTPGTVTYYLEAVEGTCPSLTRTAVTLTIEQAPSPPVWITDIVECAQSTIQTITAVASVPAGQTITWFASNFGGFPIANPTLNSVGTVTYFAEANRGSCKSLSRTPVTLTINLSPAPPLSGGNITQCANSPIQTLTPSATPANAGDTITWYDNLTGGAPITNPQWNTVGMKTFYAESNNGLCPSLTRTPVTLTLNAKPLAPTVIITQPDCNTSTGSFTVFPVAPGVTYSFDGGPFTNTTFYDLIADNSTHTLVAQNISNCTSSITNIVIQQQPATPNAPVVTVTQPSCTVATGTIDITPVAGETYSFDNGPYVSTINYPNLFDGSTHTIRAKNAAGCFSAITTILLDVQPTTPSAPVLTATQPSCSVSTGSISVAGNIGETYSIDGGPFTSNLTYPNLAASSTHNVRAQNAAGCISVASSFTLDPQPPTPGTPVYTITPPTCTDDFGSVDITPVPGELYSFDGGPFTAILNYPNLASASTHTVVAQNSFGCESVAAVININPQPITPLPVLYDGVICVDEITGVPYKTYILDTQLNLSTHTFVWYFNGGVTPDTGNAIQVTQPGLYGVIATNINGCSSALVTAQITSSSPGLSFDTTISNQFSNDTSVIITVNAGTGPFLYQMDFGPLQESNIFTSVTPGTHHIKVTDAAGCTDLSDEILILGYPNFFTPNEDGFNDTWNVIGLKDQPDAEIYIFDRHGKFIKQISSTTEGWDGTMNGQPLPSTDYWFRAEYIEKGQRKEFKSHFSLVR